MHVRRSELKPLKLIDTMATLKYSPEFAWLWTVILIDGYMGREV